MTKKNIVFFNIIPIILVMGTIFIASSQSSEQQDLSPIISEISDENSLREVAGAVIQRLDGYLERVITFAKDHTSIVLGSVFVFAASVALVFYRLFRSSDSRLKKVIKSIIYTCVLFTFFAIFLFFIKSEAIIDMIRSQASFDHLRGILNRIDFMYAGHEVNVQSWGVNGLIEFLLRKFAHFFLFGLLGFFLYLAIFKVSRKVTVSFILSVLFVLLYGALDEYRQSFIPSRSALVEDVILDTVGGVFGASMAFVKNWISEWFRKR
ncbi:VanZ family protein [Alteribacter populi]|uniref:VanZ family protein n=1 Tax=Alteribacter populi TaxID=2011011 RepID=UPI000BBB09CE|nr:VanZ family protein [Alteribacter populi]